MAFGDTIPVDGEETTDQGTWIKFVSLGTHAYSHDPHDLNALHVLIAAPAQVISLPLDEQGKPMIVCGRCGQFVKRQGFGKDARRRTGYDPVCKECRHEQYMSSPQVSPPKT